MPTLFCPRTRRVRGYPKATPRRMVLVESDRLSAPNDGQEARRVSELFVCSAGDRSGADAGGGACFRQRTTPPR